MKDPRLSSSDAAKELETAAAALEARIRDADETRESLTNGDDEYGYVHSRPLGTGLVSCGSCGRTLAAEALAAHRKENCAGARRALGAEGVARALGGVWGAVDVPQAPAAAVVPAASPPKPAKKMTKKALKEQAAAAAAAGTGTGTGTGAGVAPGAQPMQAMQGVGGALTHRGSPAYDLQHQLFLQQQQQQQQQGGQLRRVNSAQLASLGPNDFELASGPLGMGASASMPGVVPPLTAAEKKAAGAKRKREAKAAAAKAAKVAGLSGAPTAQQPPQQQPPQQQPPQPQQPQQPGAPVTPGMYDAATLAQLNAQTARHIQQRRAAMAHRLAQQQRRRAQMEVERERNHGWTGISPLARVADVGRLRHLRQRALYSIMFHGTQQELLDRMSPNIVPAQMYLSGASEVLPPFPAVTG